MASLITPSSSNVDTSATTMTEQTSSSNSTNTFHLLEVTLISAQDLPSVSKSMRTYSVVSIQSDHKLNTRIDSKGRTNPTWNDKFMFRVDNDFLNSESSTINVDIYNTSWFSDSLIGNIRIGINDLIPPSAYQARYNNNDGIFNRFVALQIRKPSGNPQGIMNMAVTLFPFGPPVYRSKDESMIGHDLPMSKRMLENQDDGDVELEQEKRRLKEKINLWRSPSQDYNYSQVDFDDGCLNNGSMLNGSMVNSDVGPSASIVAEAIAKGTYEQPTMRRGKGIEMDDGGSSIVGDLTTEEANARGYRAREKREDGQVVVSKNYQHGSGRHLRRHSDTGLFSCFALGFEFTIVCGSNENGNGNGNGNGNASVRQGGVKSKRK